MGALTRDQTLAAGICHSAEGMNESCHWEELKKTNDPDGAHAPHPPTPHPAQQFTHEINSRLLSNPLKISLPFLPLFRSPGSDPSFLLISFSGS